MTLNEFMDKYRIGLILKQRNKNLFQRILFFFVPETDQFLDCNTLEFYQIIKKTKIDLNRQLSLNEIHFYT
jgi:hypothetical protein